MMSRNYGDNMKVILDRELEEILAGLTAPERRAFCRRLHRWSNQLYWQNELTSGPPGRPRPRSPKRPPEIPAMLLRPHLN